MWTFEQEIPLFINTDLAMVLTSWKILLPTTYTQMIPTHVCLAGHKMYTETDSGGINLIVQICSEVANS